MLRMCSQKTISYTRPNMVHHVFLVYTMLAQYENDKQYGNTKILASIHDTGTILKLAENLMYSNELLCIILKKG